MADEGTLLTSFQGIYRSETQRGARVGCGVLDGVAMFAVRCIN